MTLQAALVAAMATATATATDATVRIDDVWGQSFLKLDSDGRAEYLDRLNDEQDWMSHPVVVNDVLAAEIALASDDETRFADLLLAHEGHQVFPHGIHLLQMSALRHCRKQGKHLVVQMPPEHGKSSQVVKWLVWQLGKNPKLRIGLVSGDYDLAKRNLILIRKTICSPITQAIFPHLKPDTKASKTSGGWSKERLYLQDAMFPAFEIFPLDGGAEGVRLDIILLDDSVTRKCQRSEAERERAHSAIHGTWLSRVTRGGMCVFLNNVWHRDDPIHKMVNSPSFCTLWIGYNGTESIYWRVHHPPKSWHDDITTTNGTLDLWAPWPQERLESRRNEDRLTYKRLYEGHAIVSEDCRFVPAERWTTYRTDELPDPSLGGRCVAWLDPTGGKTLKNEDYAACWLLLITFEREIYVLDMWCKRASAEDQAARLWHCHRMAKRLGYTGGVHTAVIEVLAKDQRWIAQALHHYQDVLKKDGDPDWKLNWSMHNPTENKEARIDAAAPYVERGWVKFPEGFLEWKMDFGERGESWKACVAQIEDYPFGDHDDAPDGLSGGIVLAETVGPAVVPELERTPAEVRVQHAREQKRELKLTRPDRWGKKRRG